jgi:hypothetical protein
MGSWHYVLSASYFQASISQNEKNGRDLNNHGNKRL